MKIAQLLVSQRDFLEQQRWAEIRDTISACLEAGVVPVINENDTTNTAAGLGRCFFGFEEIQCLESQQMVDLRHSRVWDI